MSHQKAGYGIPLLCYFVRPRPPASEEALGCAALQLCSSALPTPPLPSPLPASLASFHIVHLIHHFSFCPLMIHPEKGKENIRDSSAASLLTEALFCATHLGLTLSIRYSSIDPRETHTTESPARNGAADSSAPNKIKAALPEPARIADYQSSVGKLHDNFPIPRLDRQLQLPTSPPVARESPSVGHRPIFVFLLPITCIILGPRPGTWTNR